MVFGEADRYTNKKWCMTGSGILKKKKINKTMLFSSSPLLIITS